MRFTIGRQVIPRMMPGAGVAVGSLVSTGVEISKRVIRGARVRATEQERAEQLATCLACEQHRDGRCSVCGCFVGIKSWLLGFCPLGKHHSVDTPTK